MAKRTLNRKDLRADFDAAERRQKDEEEKDETEEETDAEDEAEEEGEEEEAGDEEEEAPVAKKRKPAKAAKVPKVAKPKTTKSRSRASKIVRQRVVWGVFDNANRCVSTFAYPRRQEAEDLAAKLTVDKKNTHFIQPVKEPIEEKQT